MIDLSKYKIHDLTHTLDDKIAGFTARQTRSLQTDGWNANTLTIYSHAGTHMDAPFHFGVNDQTIDEFRPIDLMGKAWIVDVDVHRPKQLIQIRDVIDQLAHYQPGDSLLLRTHWSRKYDQPDFKPDLPRISEALAGWCVTQRVKMLGVEPLSVADVENLPEVTRIHRILLGGNVIIIEGLKNLDLIQANQVFLIALPLKIGHGDGAPARVIAFEE